MVFSHFDMLYILIRNEVRSYRECKCSSYALKSAREHSLVWCKY